LQPPIFINKLWNQKLEIAFKVDFSLNISNFYMTLFAMSLKYKNLFMDFFTDFYIAYLLKSFLRVMF
jgi:hypothetical protein